MYLLSTFINMTAGRFETDAKRKQTDNTSRPSHYQRPYHRRLSSAWNISDKSNRSRKQSSMGECQKGVTLTFVDEMALIQLR